MDKKIKISRSVLGSIHNHLKERLEVLKHDDEHGLSDLEMTILSLEENIAEIEKLCPDLALNEDNQEDERGNDNTDPAPWPDQSEGSWFGP